MRRLAFAAVATCMTVGAQATVLTFDIDGIANFQNVNQGYGDNVTATTMGGFGYGVGSEGFTPDVVAEYDTVGDGALWINGYGDLNNILFKDSDGVPDFWVKLTAAPGFVVTLHSWDMAAFSSAFSSDPTINSVSVTNESNTVLWSQNNVSISESTHTSFDFSSSPLVGQEILLRFNAGNLGGLSDDIALDNIRFGQQPVPEPATFATLALGAVAFLKRRRRA